MDWNKCEKEFISEVTIDKERVISLRKMAQKRFERAQNSEDISFVVEDYYEVIKELLIAYLLLNGLKSKNHQCLISFFYKDNPEYEYEATLIQNMSYFRNRLEYYGEEVPKEFYEKNNLEFKPLVELLFKMTQID
jgi:uncharacterized protein (UPF0332 family)